MASISYKASAPGSMMLLGEYAVLLAKPALVCSIDKRIHVCLTPRPDKIIRIKSALGELEISLARLTVAPPFQFVLATLKKFRKKLPSGCDLVIVSEFSAVVGLGSSSAVTVATLAALNSWLGLKLSPKLMIKQARDVIRSVQGLGSGADVAASVLGGMVAYRQYPLMAQRLKHTIPLTAVYSGYKTPTVTAVTTVKKTFAKHVKIFQQICNAIGECATVGIKAASKANWVELGKMLTVQQGLLAALGVSTPLLTELVQQLQQTTGMLGAKISGSGMGDCVIGVGVAATLTFQQPQVTLIPITITTQGVVCEKI